MPRSRTREAITMSYLDTLLILLVGRDGNGKTSCKRSIENVSNKIEVVECSGVGDTGSDRLDDIETVWNHLRTTIENCILKGGFKAIIFVMKYGVRFTKQEKDAVEDVKAMFGEDVFRNHGIILMSYGDLFANDIAETNDSFMSWCRQQTGDIKKLFEEVDHRIVLFNNRTNNIDENKAQVEELRSFVARVGNSYGLKEFKMAPNSIKFNPTSKSEKDFRLLFLYAIIFIVLLVLSIYNEIPWFMVLSIGGILFIIFVWLMSLKANAAPTISRDSSFNYTRLPMKN